MVSVSGVFILSRPLFSEGACIEPFVPKMAKVSWYSEAAQEVFKTAHVDWKEITAEAVSSTSYLSAALLV